MNVSWISLDFHDLPYYYSRYVCHLHDLRYDFETIHFGWASLLFELHAMLGWLHKIAIGKVKLTQLSQTIECDMNQS